MNSLLFIVASNITVACFIAVVACSVGRWSKSAALTHLLWVAVFIKLITPPLIVAPVSVPSSWGLPFQSVYRVLIVEGQERDSSQTLEQAVVETHEPAAVSSFGKSPGVILGVLRDVTFTGCLVTIWLLGTSLIFIRGVLRFTQFSRLLVREATIDDEATAVVTRLIAGRRKIAPVVRRVEARVSPMLFGVGRATCIVCPNRLWDQLNEAQREAFLAHEVAHFMRRDHWLRWLEWFVTAVYWWFPLVYLARKQLERHEEAACDAWAVLCLSTSRRVYAETLLTVVDFLSENRVGVPRLASRMQGTDSLEERLRLIMTTSKKSGSSTMRTALIVTAGLTLLLIHPIPRPAAAAAVKFQPTELVESVSVAKNSAKFTEESKSSHMSPPLISLPPVPKGWWNEPPTRKWADIPVGDSDLKLLAEAGEGIFLFKGNQSQHVFDPNSLRAVAHIASSGRLIIGNANGELHLWDIASSQAVSLIGRHPECVTSIAYHPKSGLVSGDAAGNVMAWDIQSGQIKGAASMGGPVCSVRWAAGGDKLAIVVSDWASPKASAKLVMLDGNSLVIVQTLQIPHDVAVAQQHKSEGWLAVDWQGTLWSLVTGSAIGSVPKECVSGLTLCQDILDRVGFLAFRPQVEIEAVGEYK